MSVLRSKDVKLRKDRKCFGCLTLMKKGESANVQTNVNDGRIYDIHLCIDCQVKVSQMRYDDEFYEGDLR